MCRFYVCAASGFSFISVFVSVFVSEFFARILICKFIGIVWGVAGGALKMGHVMGIRRGPLAHLCTSICIDGPPEYERFGWELKWARDPLNFWNPRHSLKVTTLSLACMCRST